MAVLGGGGHAKVVLATLAALGVAVEAVLDDDPRLHGTRLLGVEVGGPAEALAAMEVRRAVVAVGDNAARRRLVERLEAAVPGLVWVSAAHPAAVVHESVVLGPGTVVFAGAVVQPEAAIGAHAIVNTASSVDHDCRLGDFVHVAPGVRLAGGVEVGDGALLGLGCRVLPGVRIGAGAVVGAGATVIHDVGEGWTVVGMPASRRGRRG